LYNYIKGLIRKVFGIDDDIYQGSKLEDVTVITTRKNYNKLAKEKREKYNKLAEERYGKKNESSFDLERSVKNIFDDLGGRILTKKELKLLKHKLKSKYGVDLRLIDKEKGIQKLPITVKGKTVWVRSEELLKDWNQRSVVGKFHEGPPPVMILRSNNASELTVFHEKVHMEVWHKKLPKMHIVDEEKLVFDEIFKARHKYNWTNDELIDAYDYVNEKVNDWNKLGKNFS
jgi:hypothetical protein